MIVDSSGPSVPTPGPGPVAAPPMPAGPMGGPGPMPQPMPLMGPGPGPRPMMMPGESPALLQALKYLEIGTCPASQKLLAYMEKMLIYIGNHPKFHLPCSLRHS